MSSHHPSKALRELIRNRAQGRCEYCTYPDHACYATFNCDHCVPERVGGLTHEDNLAWACPTCNASKSAAETGIDSTTGKTVQLFNPRRESWARHFKWSADALTILGKTPKGRATIDRLMMNRPAAKSIRALLLRIELHPPR